MVSGKELTITSDDDVGRIKFCEKGKVKIGDKYNY